MRALATLALVLACSGCAGVPSTPLDSDVVPPVPGEGVPMGTFSGTQVIDEDAVHGTVEFVDGWKSGREQLWYANGKPKLDAHWKHGSIAGDYRRWAKDGKLEAEQVLDPRLGRTTVREWYGNGQLRMSGAWIDGRADGLWEWWFDDGSRITTGYFRLGLKEGVWRCWRSDGTLDEEQSGEYRADVRVGPLPTAGR